MGTNLNNPAMPLLGFDVHDLALGLEDGCPCGRPGRVVAAVDGRIEDYLVLPSGARLGRVDDIFHGLTNVREAQIHQRIPGQILIRVVRTAGFNPADEAQLLSQARWVVGQGTEISVEYAAALPRTRSGKLRLVVAGLEEGKVQLPAPAPEGAEA